MPSDVSVPALYDIRHNIDLAFHFIAGFDRESFLRDERTLYAIVRCLEIISEASRRLPEDFKARHTSIAWNQMAGAGNVYRHDYEDVAAWLVWDTVKSALPPLQEAVEQELLGREGRSMHDVRQSLPPGTSDVLAKSDAWLDRVYHAGDAAALAATYDRWAGTYDSDMLAIGYANVAVAAGLVGRYVQDRDIPILETGVGTGALGEILTVMGYRRLFGIDMSEGMLAKARGRGVYTDLRNRVLGEPLDFADASFGAIVSFGVFTPGHAPPNAFDELIRITRPGGHLVFTVSTAAWREGGFEAKLEALEAAGRIRLVEATAEYRPMPMSVAEANFTTRAYVYVAR